MKAKAAWAVFDNNGVVLLETISDTQRETIIRLSFGLCDIGKRHALWVKFKAKGYELRQVLIAEKANGLHIDWAEK